MIRLRLPYPPTANNLFVNVGKRRVRSKAYDAWLAKAARAIAAETVPGVAGAYHLAVYAERPDRRARDIDNLLKPISDALTKAGVIADDSKAETIFARWQGADPVKGAGVVVVVEAVKPETKSPSRDPADTPSHAVCL